MKVQDDGPHVPVGAGAKSQFDKCPDLTLRGSDTDASPEVPYDLANLSHEF